MVTTPESATNYYLNNHTEQKTLNIT